MTSPDGGGLNVYLIEDDPDHVLLITRAIKEVAAQTEVQSFLDGETALSSLRDPSLSPPDLVLLDIKMPGLSGFDVLSAIKDDERLRRIPVVMVTSSELPTDIARAYNLGASGYISKPSYMQDLQAVLGNTLLYWSFMSRPSSSEAVR
ncbi:MAG TPA: response regulator [Thermomicrobiaceae bacterium]|nr:response regulator [Thermomicrobiaceae bacterium]